MGPTLVFSPNVGPILWNLYTGNDDHWVGDWSTLRACAAEPEFASITCSIKETVFPGHEFDRDPRTILKRMEKEMEDKHGVTFLVGFEIEFYLLDRPDADSTIPTSNTGFWSASGYRTPSFQVLPRVVAALEQAGVEVWSFVVESGVEYEVALAPATPSVAIDNLAYAHETIKTIAFQAGYHATMHPKAFKDGPVAGQHIHISISKPELNDHFLAGILKHYRALSTFLQGGYDSYTYALSRQVAFGGGSVHWSTCKVAPIHQIDPALAHYELRNPDALSNPSLQLAVLIGAAMNGISNRYPLEMKASPPNQHAALGDELKAELGVVDMLPSSLEEAIAATEEKESLFRSILGDPCYDVFMYLQKQQVEAAQKMSVTDRRKQIVGNI